MSDSLTVIARIISKLGKEEQLREALEALIEPTLKEEGCINYELHQGVEEPSVFVFYENWASKELHAKHMNSPHLNEFKEKMDDLLAAPIQIDLVKRISY